jgi:hypothetical protein
MDDDHWRGIDCLDGLISERQRKSLNLAIDSVRSSDNVLLDRTILCSYMELEIKT